MYSENALIAESKPHGEIVFVVFEGGHVAMLVDDLPVKGAEAEMYSGDGRGGHEKMQSARLDPRLTRDWHPDDGWKEREIFEEGESQIRLLSSRLTRESNCLDIQKEDVCQQNTNAGSKKGHTCCC